ncbi:MAG: tetratricopeptide repeat protein [Deltaproteobacteria bacterium]|nr:tetratricopeptide repeat protein [Deltaproteobacteria bacterium]
MGKREFFKKRYIFIFSFVSLFISLFFPFLLAQDETDLSTLGIEPIKPKANISKELKPLDEVWEKRKELIREGKIGDKDKKYLEELYQRKLDWGIKNLPFYTASLCYEAVKASKKKDYLKANLFLNYAQKLSPDSFLPFLIKSKVLWDESRVNFFSSMTSYIHSINKSFNDFFSSLYLFSNLYFYIITTFLLAFFLFAFFIVLKYFSLFLNNIRHSLTYEIPTFCLVVLSLIILLLPIFFNVGFFWLLVYWILILWVHMSSKEKVISIIIMIIAISLPWLLQQGIIKYISIKSEMLSSLYKARSDRWNDTIKNRLKDYVSQHSDEELLLTIGLLNKKEGNLNKAKEFYKKILKVNPKNYKALNNMGNILLIEDEVDKAIKLYKESLKYQPKSPAAWFNLGRSYLIKSFYLYEESEQAITKARRLSPELIDFYLKIEKQQLNRYIIDDEISILTLKKFLQKEGRLNDIMGSYFWGYFMKRIPYSYYFIAPILLLALVIILLFLFDKHIYLIKCEKCGRVDLRIPVAKGDRAFLCSQCYHLFVRKSKVHPKLMDKKKLQIKRFRIRKKITDNLLSILFPGAIQLMRGQTIRSIIIFLILSFFVIKTLFPQGIVEYPIMIQGMHDFSRIILYLLFILFYIIVLWESYRYIERDII